MAREPVRLVTGRWRLDGVTDPPDASVVGTPARRHASLRRTSHLQLSWPDGDSAPMHLVGRARDLVTTSRGDALVRGEDELRLEVGASRIVTSSSVRPSRDGADGLVGASVMRGFRAAADAALPDERVAVAPVMALLDDVPAVSMIGGIAWAQQRPLVIPTGDAPSGGNRSFQRTAGGAIACSGLRPGGYYEQSLDRQITFPHWVRLAGALEIDDEWAWHRIDPAPEVCFRRRRRIDAWREDAVIQVDAHFRDSVWGPAHDELALHEYTLTATIDADSCALRALAVAGRVLPFPECLDASTQVDALVGSDVRGLRAGVHRVLTGVECCTHLNDMLRGLAEVPVLTTWIDA